MTNQRGEECDQHPGYSVRCFCDEAHDLARGIHRPGGVADAFGGYECICDKDDCPGGRFPFTEEVTK